MTLAFEKEKTPKPQKERRELSQLSSACDLRAVITARAAPTRNLCPKCPRDGCPNSAPASKGPGDSPQAPEQPGKLQKTGVSGETELAFRQGQLAVLERVVRHSDAQGPAGEDGPGQPPPG